MENEIGAKLLERNRVGVTLTVQGEEVLALIQEIDSLHTQLLRHFKTDSYFGDKAWHFNIYYFACSNYGPMNNLILKMQKNLPNVVTNLIEASNEEAIIQMMDEKNAAIAAIISFDDYPQLRIVEENLPEDFEILSDKTAKLVALCAANNPIYHKYASISMESLLHKPMIFYSPYKLEDNHFYRLAKLYGEPHIKYTATNLQSFYYFLKNGDCTAIGATTGNSEAMFNPLFSKEQQFHTIPIRDAIKIRIMRIINKRSLAYTNPLIRDLIFQSL